MTSSFLLILATYLALGIAVWTIMVIISGDNASRRQRDFDILHAIDDLRREIEALRRKISDNHRLP